MKDNTGMIFFVKFVIRVQSLRNFGIIAHFKTEGSYEKYQQQIHHSISEPDGGTIA